MKKNLAIFAGYSKEGNAEEYVLYYIKKLLEVADVIVVFDNEFRKEEKEKIAALGVHIIDLHHGEYDFGSYKRGYQWASEQGILGGYEKLIFCNDSCLGPFHPISNIIDNYNGNDEVDFFGAYKIIDRHRHSPHIQSYFICFKSHIFLNKVFDDFIGSISLEKSKTDIVTKYEIGLSAYLHGHGFKSEAIFSGKKYRAGNSYALKLLKNGFPFLKKGLFYPDQPIECRTLLFYKRCFKKLGLNDEIDMIDRYLFGKIGQKQISRYLFMVWFKNTFLRYIFRYKKREGRIYVKILSIPFFSFKTRH